MELRCNFGKRTDRRLRRGGFPSVQRKRTIWLCSYERLLLCSRKKGERNINNPRKRERERIIIKKRKRYEEKSRNTPAFYRGAREGRQKQGSRTIHRGWTNRDSHCEKEWDKQTCTVWKAVGVRWPQCLPLALLLTKTFAFKSVSVQARKVNMNCQMLRLPHLYGKCLFALLLYSEAEALFVLPDR